MLLGALTENLLTLLAFDDDRASLIRNSVDVDLFGGPYKVIAARMYDYVDRYKKAPRDHLPDILADKLDGEKREAELYTDIITSMHAAQQTINVEYVMGQLSNFVRRQSLRSVAVDLAKALQRDTEDSLEEADNIIRQVQVNNLTMFDPGLRLSDSANSLGFLEFKNEAFSTGIAELDKRGFGPTRKELWLAVANTKGGKTWLLMHLAKIAAVHRLRVCHISLEMSQQRAAQRYYQAFFAISKRPEQFRVTKVIKDNLGRITDLETVPIKASMTLEDRNIRDKLERKIAKGHRVLHNIIVKEFPTGTLTVHQLLAYLDNLENTERFTPDLLVVDYPDLMRLSRDEYRLALDQAYKDLRGIAVSRNLALAVVSQSHRQAAGAKLVRADNVAEAYSKTQHADTVVTISQTQHEAALGLARLHVAAGRNDKDKITVVITQSFDTGQFVVDSTLMKGNYFGNIPQAAGEEE